jgi:hypothetical protein
LIERALKSNKYDNDVQISEPEEESRYQRVIMSINTIRYRFEDDDEDDTDDDEGHINTKADMFTNLESRDDDDVTKLFGKKEKTNANTNNAAPRSNPSGAYNNSPNSYLFKERI